MTLTETDAPPNFPPAPISPEPSAPPMERSASGPVPYMPSGSNYTIAGAHLLYLTNQKPVLLTGNLTGQNTRLWGGDATNDGSVGILDLTCIGGDFGIHHRQVPALAWAVQTSTPMVR